MLHMASRNAVRHSGSSIKIKSLNEKKEKILQNTYLFFLKIPENLILPLAIGSASSVTTAWHEEKHSPEHTAESPQLMMKPCSKPALQIIKGQPCIPWHFRLGFERGSITHWPSPIPLKPRGRLWPWWQKRG